MRHERNQRENKHDNFSEQSLSKALQAHRKSYLKRKGIFYKGSRIASRAEFSCIKALETFTDWKLIEGKTYQIPIGHQKTVDFRIKDQLIEFHPIIFSREMDANVYKAFKIFASKLREDQRFEIREIFRAHILEEYAHKRHWTIQQNADNKIASAELLVVTDAESFFKYVIKPNATRRLPTVAQFRRKFKAANFGT